ncbi:MAG: hypothetical protein ACKOES_14365 [Planctomycetaceae bacterium]
MPRRQPQPTGRLQRRKTRHAVAAASPSRRKKLAALAAESDRQLEELIAWRLALPVDKRMNFLRRRLPGGGSCL